MSIYGYQDKPPMGRPPSYTETLIDNLPGLTKIDSMIMRLSCENVIETCRSWIETNTLLERIKSLGIHQKEFLETLEVLDRRSYIEATREIGGDIQIIGFSITGYGFEEYARTYIDNYDSIVESVAFQIVNLDKRASDSISTSTSLNQPQKVVDHILRMFENKGLIKMSNATGGGPIYDVSPELKRMLRKP